MKPDEEKPESKPGSRKASLTEEKAKKAEVKIICNETNSSRCLTQKITNERLFMQLSLLLTKIKFLTTFNQITTNTRKKGTLLTNNEIKLLIFLLLMN